MAKRIEVKPSRPLDAQILPWIRGKGMASVKSESSKGASTGE